MLLMAALPTSLVLACGCEMEATKYAWLFLASLSCVPSAGYVGTRYSCLFRQSPFSWMGSLLEQIHGEKTLTAQTRGKN